MQRAFFTALLLTAGLILPAGAEVVHKWVDADGITHYSDAAPLDPGAETLAIEVTAPPPRASAG